MTKPTDSKVTAAFQAMLAFLRYLFTGDAKWSSAPEMIGVLSACSLSATPMLSDPDLLALRDLVQAAADEHAGSASPAAPSPAWLRGEALHPDVVAAAPSADGDPFAAIRGALDARWTAPQPSASHIGVDPAQSGGDRTVTQVREPAFDRLAAAVGMLRRTRFTDDMAVVQAFDAFVAARAAEVEPATPAETLTFTRLKGETPEAFRARIALHLNGMGSARYVLPGQDGTREALGAIVRGVWIKWAKEQPSPKPSWLVPWEGLSEPDKEVDRRIGVALATVGQGFAGAIDAPVLSEEAAGRWAAVIGRRCSSLREEPLDVVAGELLAASRGEYPTT